MTSLLALFTYILHMYSIYLLIYVNISRKRLLNHEKIFQTNQKG